MSNTKNRRVILYMAISADGFIAGQDSETPWSEEEWVAFQEFVKSCDYCIMGSTTYDIMRKDNSFVPDTNFLVATNNPDKDTGVFEKIVIKSGEDLPEGEKIGIIGGGNLNGSIADLGLIDEINLDIEPIILGSGIRLFGDHTPKLNLKLQSSKKIGSGTIQNHYIVL